MKKLFITLIPILMLFTMTANCLPLLSSLSSAKATIFLDFDGQFVQSSSWNGGNSLNCAPSGLSDAQIIEIFNRVSEDFRPFDMNITTDSTKFLAAPLTQRIRIIITPTSSWYTGVGGVAYTGSFKWGDDTPGFVFCDRLGPNNTKMVAECCTHESGHTVGLSHQAKYNGTCTLLTTYNTGSGSGETGWAPVMGNSYYENFSGWYNGPTPSGCTADQDALSIITSVNGFTYRTDDHSDNPAINPTTINILNNVIADSGIITTNTDKDAFHFSVPKTGIFHMDAKPFSVGANNEGADLDIKLELLNSNLQVLQVYDPINKLNVAIDTTLAAGDYYLVVEGAGNVNTSNYGSLGSYNLSGTFLPLSVTPIKQVLLSGKTDKGSNLLNWNIVADEPIKFLSLESSPNAINFTILSLINKEARNFTYLPLSNENIYYRLKAISISGEVVYSNVISIKANNGGEKAFKVSTIVHDEVTVDATQNFDYRLADMSGRIIQVGKGKSGTNTINLNTSPNGIYLIQILSNNQRQTERIIRL